MIDHHIVDSVERSLRDQVSAVTLSKYDFFLLALS